MDRPIAFGFLHPSVILDIRRLSPLILDESMCFTEYVNHTTSTIPQPVQLLYTGCLKIYVFIVIGIPEVFPLCAQHFKCVCTVIRIKSADPLTCGDASSLISDYLESWITLFLFYFCFVFFSPLTVAWPIFFSF